MTSLLLKLFVKNREDTTSPKVRTAYGVLSGVVGIICNVLLCAGKLAAGFISGSVSVVADAVNNLNCRTDGWRLVHVPGDVSLLGQRKKVKITDCSTWSLFGEFVEE